MIPQDWQGRLKIDYMTHLGAELIKKQRQKKKTAENTGYEADQRDAERKRKPDN